MIRRFFALVAVASLLVGTFVLLPSWGLKVGAAVPPHKISVAPQDLQLVCPGPLLKGAKNNVARFLPEGEALTLAVSSPLSRSTYQIAGANQETVTQKPVVFRSSDWVALVGAPKSPEVNGSALLASLQLQRLESDWAGGLLGTSCQRPSNDLWLVGGDTRTGREALLVLTNSSNVDATVELTVFTTGGKLTAAGLSGISVPKRDTTVLPINGLIPNTESFAIRVQSSGGSVGGWIQQRAVRGTKAAGIDWISPVAEASTEITIPGFLVRGSNDAKTLQESSSKYSDLTNFVRVVNPGDTDATVLVRVTGANSNTFGTVLQGKVAARSVLDFEVTGLDDGDYTIFVSSDQAVLAAAKLNRTNLANTPVTDFTWLPSLDSVTGRQVLPLPVGGISKVALVNNSNSATTVELRSDGTAQKVKLSASATAIVKVSGGLLELFSELPIAATVILDVRGSVTNFAMVEYRNLGGSVSVVIQ